ncbi:hypothetical protein MesoLj131c_64980 [Mesorhizobium sp. 131-3-5]|nr:hypothetical protein MesoLj131c_64980 [Mesorhizobium sp. 131-3-5]
MAPTVMLSRWAQPASRAVIAAARTGSTRRLLREWLARIVVAMVLVFNAD